MSTRNSLGVSEASRMLDSAITRSNLTSASVANSLGLKSHVAVWGWRRGSSKIPLNTAIDIGIAAGMTEEEALEFFIANLQVRDDDLHKAFLRAVNYEVKNRLARISKAES